MFMSYVLLIPDVFHPYVFVLSRRVSKKMVLHDTLCLAVLYGCMLYGTGRRETRRALAPWYYKDSRSIDTLSVVTRPPSCSISSPSLPHPPFPPACQRESVLMVRVIWLIYMVDNSWKCYPFASTQVLLSCCSVPPSPYVRSCSLSMELHQVMTSMMCVVTPEPACYQEVLPEPPATLASLAWAGSLMSSSP